MTSADQAGSKFATLFRERGPFNSKSTAPWPKPKGALNVESSGIVCLVDIFDNVTLRTFRGDPVAKALIPFIALCAVSPAHCQEDLAALWNLAVANNPALREATAEVDASHGRLLQAQKYPNPRFAYRETVLGTSPGAAGDLDVQAIQEIVTSGKRRLDIALASRVTDIASVALERRKFEVLTAVRRAYYDYLSWAYTEQVSSEIVAALEQLVEISRRQVEEAKIRPRSDLLRIQAILGEARISQQNAGVRREAGWRQVAAEVGVPGLPLPESPAVTWGPFPEWEADVVLRRVLAANSQVKEAAIETARVRLEIERRGPRRCPISRSAGAIATTSQSVSRAAH